MDFIGDKHIQERKRFERGKVSRTISSLCTMHTIWIASESLLEAPKRHFSEVTLSEKGLRDLFQ